MGEIRREPQQQPWRECQKANPDDPGDGQVIDTTIV